MNLRERLRAVRDLPRLIVRWREIWRVWNRDDWSRLLELLDGSSELERKVGVDRILRGIALSRTGRHPAAIEEFEQIRREDMGRWEEVAYFTEYAYALHLAGRTSDAIALLHEAPVGRFPKSQQDWATKFLADHRDFQEYWRTSLPGLDQQWTHWWIEGDEFRVEVVPGENPLRVGEIVKENRPRMRKIVAYRARFEPSVNDYVHESNSYGLSTWSPWTGKP